LLDRASHERFDIGSLGYIGAKAYRCAAGLLYPLNGFGWIVDVGKHELCALGGECRGQRQADAARGAGYDRHPTLEAQGYRSRPFQMPRLSDR
jgi:hypothetical protein